VTERREANSSRRGGSDDIWEDRAGGIMEGRDRRRGGTGRTDWGGWNGLTTIVRWEGRVLRFDARSAHAETTTAN